tara:strand:- start:94 stop:510 length:417 start_codon:yes stop_codon:yes gene_type:complete
MPHYKQNKRIIKYALITLFTVFLLPAVAAHGDEKNHTILGAGEISCRVVLKNPEDKGLRKFYQNWAQGWITATNYFGDYIRLGLEQKSVTNGPLPNDIAPREDVIWYKILSFCSEEPKALLSDAVKELLNSQWRKQAK